MDLDDAIARSCDVYFYGLANEIGVDRISTFMAPFGFGKPTGIDIGGERAGILPSREWKEKRFARPADRIWFPGETVSFGIGQGYLTVTPLELAHYASVLATRGKIWRPRLVAAWRDPRTVEVHHIAPESEGEVKGVSEDDWGRVVHGMIGVTQRGTAAAIGAHAPYVFAGKTGTAQVYTVAQNDKYNASKINERLRDHSWFIAFAPAEQPRIAVAVLVENGGFGASAAAPIARKVLDAYLLDADGKVKPQLMIYEEISSGSRTRRTLIGSGAPAARAELDGPLVVGLSLIAPTGWWCSTVPRARACRRCCAPPRGWAGTVAMLLLAQVNPNFLRRSSPWLYPGVRAAAGRRGDRPHRQGCAALARSWAYSALPALRAHEARGADDVRLVSARSRAAAVAHLAGGARGANLRAGGPGGAAARSWHGGADRHRRRAGHRDGGAAACASMLALAALARSAPGSAGRSCTTTRESACSPSSTRRPIRSAPATTSSSRRSPSARAAYSARAG